MRRVAMLLFMVVALFPPGAIMSTAIGAPGDVALVSTADDGTKGNGHSLSPALPADGSLVAFRSEATNLDPSDDDPGSDEYVKDLSTGDLRLISTSDGGEKGNGFSANPVFSADASRVAFRSGSTNLDPADTDEIFDIFVKDLASGDIMLASTGDDGTKGDNSSYNPFLSVDGGRVAFRSFSTNLDPADGDRRLDVYVKDLATGDLVLASTSDGGVKGNAHSGNPALSADGTRVAFYSSATNLDPADTDTLSDIYVKDLVTGDLALASTSDAGIKGNGTGGLPFLSADGTRVAFRSDATNLDPADTDRRLDVYVKDLVTGDLTLVSAREDGIKGNGNSVSPYLSADGSLVAFDSSSTNLDPADPDAVSDVYVKDLATGNVTLVSSSATGDKGDGPSSNAALSGDGSRVAFYSAAMNLHPGDGDGLQDAFVKEIDLEADVSMAVTDAPDPVPAGGILTYTIETLNAGPASAAQVTVTDLLPAGLTFLSATPSQGTCTEEEGLVTCTLGGLAPAAAATIVLDVIAESPGTVVNEVHGSALEPDPDASDNVAVASTTVDPSTDLADLAVNVVDEPDPVKRGEILTYTVEAGNAGTSDATEVRLEQVLPGGVKVESITPSQGTCGLEAGTVVCELGTLSSGTSAAVVVEVTPKRSRVLLTSASVSAAEQDPDPGDNAWEESTIVERR
jgi:uncharacterized repeat protein (TIGR01451 family)